MNSVVRWITTAAVSLTCALGSTTSSAVTYQYFDLPCGDTCYVVDMNNRGDILMTGFADGFRQAVVAHFNGLEIVPSISTTFLSAPDLGGSSEFSAYVIDSHGNISGEGFPIPIPLIWIDDVPYNMNDPVNAGISLGAHDTIDHLGPFDIATWDIVGLTGIDMDAGYSVTSALKSASGLMVIDRVLPSSWDIWGVLVPIPEPATLGLSLTALLAIAVQLKLESWRQRFWLRVLPTKQRNTMPSSRNP